MGMDWERIFAGIYQLSIPSLYQHQKNKGVSIKLTPCLIWRKRRDSNFLEPFRVAGFQDRCLQPLGHTSGMRRTINIPVRHVKTECVRLREKQAKFR